MKSGWMIFSYSACLGLVLSTVFVLATPVAHAASCNAPCYNGSTVSVSGSYCACTDYMACWYQQTPNGQMYTKYCPM
jgi:hypothetical protein